MTWISFFGELYLKKPQNENLIPSHALPNLYDHFLYEKQTFISLERRKNTPDSVQSRIFHDFNVHRPFKNYSLLWHLPPGSRVEMKSLIFPQFPADVKHGSGLTGGGYLLPSLNTNEWVYLNRCLLALSRGLKPVSFHSTACVLALMLQEIFNSRGLWLGISTDCSSFISVIAC